jgi:transcription elongation factor GreA
MQTFPITVLGLNQLAEELRRLKTEERPAAIQAIADARTQGEISENAEYFAAREYQSFVEGRIAEIEEIVASADAIDPATLSGDHVVFGAYVSLLGDDNENETEFQIVGVHEADIKKGRLSVASPLGKALIGKKVGDTVSVPTPSGDRTYTVRDIHFG